MKMIKGTERHTNRCGGNSWSWFTVSDQDLAQNPGSVAEPVGSFHHAACYVARERDMFGTGKITDVRVVANPIQQWWDSAYDQWMIVPAWGRKIEIERLDRWFNIGTIGEARRNKALQMTVWRTMWVRARKHAGNTEELLKFLRGWVKANPEVLGLCEEDDLWDN